MADPTLHVPLFVFGSVIVAILLQVAHFTGALNPVRNLNTTTGGQIMEFFFEATERRFGEVMYLGHAHRVTGGEKPCAACLECSV
jgi:hypothetical protein